MFKAAVLIAASSYFAWYMEQFEISMVYPFDATHMTPADAGEDRLMEVRLPTEDGESLVLWRLTADPGKPTILYLPGNAGGLKDRADRFTALLDRGYGLIAVGYRGSSGSSGAPDQDILINDARQIATSLDAAPLVFYGESLGTSIAIKLAAEGLGDAVVLEAPFTSFVDIVAVQYPSDDLSGLLTQHWNSEADVPGLRQPLLVVHGENDKIVPIELGEQIFAAAGSQEKEFIRIAGLGHHGLWTAEMTSKLFSFLDAR